MSHVAHPERMAHLDGLRGLAALAVGVYHVWLSTSLADRARVLALPDVVPSLEVIARFAVVLFFVLSGYVLTASWQSERAYGWAAWAARRMVRLFPPFAAAAILSAGFYWLIGPAEIENGGLWLHTVLWGREPDLPYVLGHLSLNGTHDFVWLNPVSWSLVQELRMSLLMPLLVWAVFRLSAVSLVAGGVALQVCSWALLSRAELPLQPFTSEDPFGSFILTLHFIPAFALGALLAFRREQMGHWLSQRGTDATAAIWAAALILMSLPQDGAVALGATLVIALSGQPVLRSLLVARPILWLGQVSYSYYLIHIPVMLAVIHGLHGTMPVWALAIAGALLSLPAASLLFHAVERPSIALSRRASRRIAALRR